MCSLICFHLYMLRTPTFSHVSSMSWSHLRNPIIQYNLMYTSCSNFPNCLLMISCRFLLQNSMEFHSSYLVIMYLHFSLIYIFLLLFCCSWYWHFWIFTKQQASCFVKCTTIWIYLMVSSPFDSLNNSFGKNTSNVKFELPTESHRKAYDVSFFLVGDAMFNQEINFEVQLGL